LSRSNNITYSIYEPVSNSDVGNQIENNTRIPFIGDYAPLPKFFRYNFANVTTNTGKDYTFAYSSFNKHWIVRRDNATNVWTLVAFMWPAPKIDENIGFNDSTLDVMAWGTSVENKVDWINLLQPDSHYTNRNTISILDKGYTEFYPY
jgi:hypothetical protein